MVLNLGGEVSLHFIVGVMLFGHLVSHFFHFIVDLAFERGVEGASSTSS
jgi:hypothetical protein